MTGNDDAILEFLADTELALPPRAIHYNLETRHAMDVSYTTINRRLKALLDAGLVAKEYEEGGFYAISEKGRAYLKGDVDADELARDAE